MTTLPDLWNPTGAEMCPILDCNPAALYLKLEPSI